MQRENLEIGSEFTFEVKKEESVNDIKSFLALSGNGKILSGRTILDIVVKEIQASLRNNFVLLPSFCCETMIVPFVDNKISISFYDVHIDENGLSINTNAILDTDAIVVMNYFGFQSPAIEKFIDEMVDQDKIIIKDATQSLFSETTHDSRADYVFASLRKWMGIPDGALLAKRDGSFNLSLPQKENEDFVNLRMEAMQMKEAYINHKQGNKEDYLKKFAEASHLLAEDYAGYRMSDYSMNLLHKIDMDTLIKKRTENAAFLISNLSDCKGIQLLFNEVKPNDVPLFVPVLVKNGLRDKLRQYLIEKEIYCPVHWPLSKYHNISDESKQIYQQELSLICDQRYNSNDMAHIVKEIKNFFNNN